MYYLVGLVGLHLPMTQSLFQKLVPFSLILSTSLSLWPHRPWNTRFITTIVIIFMISFGVECLGVRTGWIFGSYQYSNALGPRLLGTPLLIGINWVLVVYGVYHLLKDSLSPTMLVITGAGLLFIFDFFMEPVAIQFQWWIWEQGTVPLQNFIAWFLCGGIFLSILSLSRDQKPNTVASFIFLVQFGFFILINII